MQNNGLKLWVDPPQGYHPITRTTKFSRKRPPLSGTPVHGTCPFSEFPHICTNMCLYPQSFSTLQGWTSTLLRCEQHPLSCMPLYPLVLGYYYLRLWLHLRRGTKRYSVQSINVQIFHVTSSRICNAVLHAGSVR